MAETIADPTESLLSHAESIVESLFVPLAIGGVNFRDVLIRMQYYVCRAQEIDSAR